MFVLTHDAYTFILEAYTLDGDLLHLHSKAWQQMETGIRPE